MARRKYQKAIYTADFETTADAEDCRVWAYAICDVYDPDSVRYGTSMDEFIYDIDELAPCKLYFHNLAFDCVFIFDYILNAGMEWTDARNYDLCINSAQYEADTAVRMIRTLAEFTASL